MGMPICGTGFSRLGAFHGSGPFTARGLALKASQTCQHPTLPLGDICQIKFTLDRIFRGSECVLPAYAVIALS